MNQPVASAVAAPGVANAAHLPRPHFAVEVFASGMNGALQRLPRMRTVAWSLLAERPQSQGHRPTWSKPKTIGVTFPAGLNLLPPKPAKAESTRSTRELPADTAGNAADLPVANPDEPAPFAVDAAGQPVFHGVTTDTPPAQRTAGDAETRLPDGESPHGGSPGGGMLAALLPVTPAGGANANGEPTLTRIKPPAEALSIEDRLFYLLQPPLETWLKGQELIMPFEPFHYQYEGIGWLFSQKAALLADEMGLGKTMQTITAIRLLMRSEQVRRVLMVCPKPLIPNWQREFRTWAEELPLVTLEGDAARRQMLWNMPGVQILLANYELLVRDCETFGDQPPQFDLVVLDEAQRIKNRDSRTASSARGLSRKRSWALTGTPIENRPEELASLYEYLEVLPAQANPDIRQLMQLAKQFILRRTKDLVMKDMPPRLDRDAIVELGPAQKVAYETAEKDGVVQLNDMGESISIQHVFELVLRLKQIANFDPATGDSSKLERLEADMEEIAASGGKAILFSQWTGTIDWLEQRLARFHPLVYHGKVPPSKREGVLAEFKAAPDRPLLMMSYATGAVGLNLQFAGYVFLFDRWWNPAVEDQAINRAHRIGQKSQVIVTKFIAKDTIEERIDRVLQEKRELFAAVLGEGTDTNRSLSLSAAEIFGLFDLKARHGKGTRAIGPKVDGADTTP